MLHIPAQSSYFLYVTVSALFLSLILLLSPVTTNTRSETEGIWTAVLPIMAFEGTAEHTKLLVFMERHSDLCLTTKACATLMQNPHMYEVIEITVFLSVFHSQKCVSMHNVTHHTESDTLRDIWDATELLCKHIPSVQ